MYNCSILKCSDNPVTLISNALLHHIHLRPNSNELSQKCKKEKKSQHHFIKDKFFWFRFTYCELKAER